LPERGGKSRNYYRVTSSGRAAVIEAQRVTSAFGQLPLINNATAREDVNMRGKEPPWLGVSIAGSAGGFGGLIGGNAFTGCGGRSRNEGIPEPEAPTFRVRHTAT